MRNKEPESKSEQSSKYIKKILINSDFTGNLNIIEVQN
jgi:hypothetical protein